MWIKHSRFLFITRVHVILFGENCKRKSNCPRKGTGVLLVTLPCAGGGLFFPSPRSHRPMAPVRGEVNPHAADGYSISVQLVGTSTTTTIYTMTGTY